jgi:thioredoxin reductase
VSTTTADVVVVGAGPAGMAAAIRVAEARRRVVVLDEAPNVGGQIWRHRSRSTLGADARRVIDGLSRTSADVRRGVAVVDVAVGGDGSFTVVAERHRGGVEVVRAPALVVATGARERFLPFPGWTLPGVLGLGGAQALLKQGATFRGKRVVIADGATIPPVAASLTDAVLASCSSRSRRRFGPFAISRSRCWHNRTHCCRRQCTGSHSCVPRTRWEHG